jgi:hypothetical protein
MGGFVLGDDPHEEPPEADPETSTLEDRVSALESRLSKLGREIRTERLVVEDDEGRPRVVAEVVGGVTELRLDVPGCVHGGGSTALLLFATEGHEDIGDPAGMGVQLWVDGNEVATYAAWKSGSRWETDVRLPPS